MSCDVINITFAKFQTKYFYRIQPCWLSFSVKPIRLESRRCDVVVFSPFLISGVLTACCAVKTMVRCAQMDSSGREAVAEYLLDITCRHI